MRRWAARSARCWRWRKRGRSARSSPFPPSPTRPSRSASLPATRVEPGPFGIMQPKPRAPVVEPDLIFVPLIAVDGARHAPRPRQGPLRSRPAPPEEDRREADRRRLADAAARRRSSRAIPGTFPCTASQVPKAGGFRVMNPAGEGRPGIAAILLLIARVGRARRNIRGSDRALTGPCSGSVLSDYGNSLDRAVEALAAMVPNRTVAAKARRTRLKRAYYSTISPRPVTQTIALNAAQLWRQRPQEVILAGALALAGIVAIAGAADSTPTFGGIGSRMKPKRRRRRRLCSSASFQPTRRWRSTRILRSIPARTRPLSPSRSARSTRRRAPGRSSA